MTTKQPLLSTICMLQVLRKLMLRQASSICDFTARREDIKAVIQMIFYLLVQPIKDWEEGGKIVDVYFNNTIGDAVKNLMALKHYV